MYNLNVSALQTAEILWMVKYKVWYYDILFIEIYYT